LSQRPSERSLPTRRGFLVSLLGLATIATAGCGGSDGSGDFGQKFDKPKDAGPTAASPVEAPPIRRRSDEIREDRENAQKKTGGRRR
jgi:hypothetical protein